jgi:hypothetical protein
MKFNNLITKDSQTIRSANSSIDFKRKTDLLVEKIIYFFYNIKAVAKLINDEWEKSTPNFFYLNNEVLVMNKIIRRFEDLLDYCDPVKYVNDENYESKCKKVVIGYEVLRFKIGRIYSRSLFGVMNKFNEISIFEGFSMDDRIKIQNIYKFFFTITNSLLKYNTQITLSNKHCFECSEEDHKKLHNLLVKSLKFPEYLAEKYFKINQDLFKDQKEKLLCIDNRYVSFIAPGSANNTGELSADQKSNPNLHAKIEAQNQDLSLNIKDNYSDLSLKNTQQQSLPTAEKLLSEQSQSNINLFFVLKVSIVGVALMVIILAVFVKKCRRNNLKEEKSLILAGN